MSNIPTIADLAASATPEETALVKEWAETAEYLNKDENKFETEDGQPYVYTAQSVGYSEFSDLYKSVNGVRPRWMAYLNEWDMAKEFLLLVEQAKRQAEEDAKVQYAETLEEKRLAYQYGVDVPTLIEWGVIPAYTDWRYETKWWYLEDQLEEKQRNGYFTPAPAYLYEEFDCLFS
jgi:hypothetical protein